MCYTCQYCGKEFTNSGGHKMHENSCMKNPNRIENLKKRKKYTAHIDSIDDITCQYCGRVFKNKNARNQHEKICVKNPNRIAKTLLQKYDMMSDDELLIEIKKYASRKETPYQLVQICKRRRIYSWTGQYTKEHSYSDEELIKELEKYTQKTQIPYGISVELKRRNISLPNRFNINPRRKYNIELQLLSTEDLINKLDNVRDIYDAHNKGLDNIISELKRRNQLPERFNGTRRYNYAHYLSNVEIISELNQYSSKQDLYKDNIGHILGEAKKRGLEIPEWAARTRYTKFHYMTNDELENILNPIKNRKELISKNLGPALSEAKTRKLNVDFSKFSKNYHPEYENMSNDEIIKIAKQEFNGHNIRSGLKVNRPLINQLRKRNIIYIVFPDSDRVAIKQNKLNLLTQYDVENLTTEELLLYILSEELPEDFMRFEYSLPGSLSRKAAIEGYKEKLGIEDIEEENDIELNKVSHIDEIKQLQYDEDDIEISILKNHLKSSYEVIQKMFDSNQIYQSIIISYINRLFFKICRLEESNDQSKFDKTIKEYETHLVNPHTDFERFIYTYFFNEYNALIELKNNIIKF